MGSWGGGGGGGEGGRLRHRYIIYWLRDDFLGWLRGDLRVVVVMEKAIFDGGG